MKLNTYCVAHVVREQSHIKARLEKVRSVLDRHAIQSFTPNLGHHVTLLPPFRTTDEAAKLLAWGLDMWDTVRIGEGLSSERFLATGVGFGFFRNPGEDAFTVKLMVDHYLTRAVERGRKRIPEIAEWVYPPENYDFNPHMTIVTGKGIADPISSLIERGEIASSLATEAFHVDFEAPRVLRKVEGQKTRWEPVL